MRIVHKRGEGGGIRIDPPPFALCGRGGDGPKLSTNWADVTCRYCLKKKGKR